MPPQAGRKESPLSPGGFPLLSRLALAGHLLLVVGLAALLGLSPSGLVAGLLVLAFLSLVLYVPSLQARLGPQRKGADLGRHISRRLAETDDPATAIFHSVSDLLQMLGVERVALFAVDGALRHAELLAEAHAPECTGAWAGRLPLDRPTPLAEAVKSCRPLFWPDVAELHLTPENASLLSANLPALYLHPVLAGSTLVGCLALASSSPGRLSRLRRKVPLETVAQVLALYIRTAGLQPDVLRAQDQIELLYEVTTHLNADLSLEKVMSNILIQALSKVGATRGSIFLLDEQGQVTHRILCRENLAPEVSALVIREIMEHGLAAWVLKNKQGTLVQDVLLDDRWMVLSDHAGHVRSAVAVPFLRQDRVEGILFLTHPEVDRFRQEHLDLLTSIANQAAIAIQNARLYEWAENERRTLAAVLDSSADAVVVIDRQGRILLVNPAARQTLGIEDRPAPLREVLLHPDLLAFLERAMTEEGTVNENVRLSDGRVFSVSVAPVRDREGRPIGRVALMHDITHLIELDEMKSRFVSTVSHDLKAPLTAIRGFAELLPVVGPLNEDQAQFVSRIREVVENMARLIGNLLDLGKIEAGLGMEVQPVNLRDILLSTKYDLAMPAQEKNILVEIEVPANLPPIQGDPYRLRQVVANYLSNAIKYTMRGGRVWIRAEKGHNEVVVSVKDTGIGIPPADLPHVFEKFYRVQDSRVIDQDGSGLGLAIVKSIIAEHDGRVWVESTLGQGSTFYFSLPTAESEEPSPPA